MFKYKPLHFLLFLFLCTTVNTAIADDYSESQSMIHQCSSVFESFSQDPNMTYFQNHVQYAKAVFIIPKLMRAGFFLGGAGGSGTLLSRDMKTGEWSYPVFYSMGSVSIGLQFGGEASEIILMIMTDRGMDSLLTTSFKLGADATVAVGPFGSGAKAATTDILAFARSKGLFAGISIEGAVIKPYDQWNASYYRKAVSPADIIIRHSVANSHANTLRSIVRENSIQKKTKVIY